MSVTVDTVEWRGAPDIRAWVEASRLNLMKGLDQRPDKGTVAVLRQRFVAALVPALAKFDEFASDASPVEHKRMFEPVA